DHTSLRLLREDLANFGNQLITTGAVFAENARDVATQTPPIILGYILSRDNNNGDTPTTRMSPQRLHEAEAIELRHHQIEQDQPGHAGGELFQTKPAIGSFLDLPAFFGQSAAQHVAGALI